MSSQLDPDVGRDDPSAPKSADLDEEKAAAPKESSGPATSIRLWLPSLRCRWRDRSRTADPRRSSYP